MIELKNVTKKYKIPHEKKDTLFEILLGYIKRQNNYEILHALRDVTFTIKKGETVGIIGKNGSGKTTLLKVISGITKPTKGTVNVHGKLSPFLSLGVGFHGELTAKENLRLHGAILGLRRDELKRKMDKIFKFANVEKFKDTKLKKFSSGMTARLAFSIMIESDSDIILLDEIFAVGDKDFRPKCEEVMYRYRDEKRTILIADHSLDRVTGFCKKTIVMDKGRVVRIGPTKKMVRYYEREV